MRLVFVNRFYWPETPATGQLLTDLTEQLAARGHQVHVVTSRAGADTPARETRCGVNIIRVRGSRAASAIGLVGKALDFATFYLGAVYQIFRLGRSGTVI